jgi:hypothetical protein
LTALGGVTSGPGVAVSVRREPPDTGMASRFDGEPMVQSFWVELDGRAAGRCWIPDPVALATAGFGQGWVAGQLAARLALLGLDEVAAQLASPDGIRLDRA